MPKGKRRNLYPASLLTFSFKTRNIGEPARWENVPWEIRTDAIKYLSIHARRGPFWANIGWNFLPNCCCCFRTCSRTSNWWGRFSRSLTRSSRKAWPTLSSFSGAPNLRSAPTLRKSTRTRSRPEIDRRFAFAAYWGINTSLITSKNGYISYYNVVMGLLLAIKSLCSLATFAHLASINFYVSMPNKYSVEWDGGIKHWTPDFLVMRQFGQPDHHLGSVYTQTCY